MNLEGGSFARCVRHPSQFFTGFCSSCLVERLSNVDSVEKSPKIVEISSSSSVVDFHRKGSNEARVRTTLLSLFQLDDCNDAIDECESKASTLGSSAACVDIKVDALEEKHLKDKNLSFWSSSVLPAKGLRWRLRGASKSGRFEDRWLERNHELRQSCDWRVCRESHESQESDKGVWEKPRHSWDGLMMSKALTCSFACLEEPQDGSSRIKRRLPEENVVTDVDRCGGTIDVSKGDNGDNESLVDEKPASPNGSLGNLIRERHHEEFHQAINDMDTSRKKSHRWSRVWDWSITSPFRDFAKKKEHVLERSLPVTLQEAHKDKSELHSGIHPYGNGIHARTNQGLNRNLHGGELQKFRPEWQRKREYRFGRSRSVHYPSPGNVDNGLLRFYLTPMRTSRRSSNNRRVQTSQFFPKGILGR